MTFDAIRKANEAIRTTDIKGKDYAEVNQRVKAFRMVYPTGYIETAIISLEGGVCTMQAVAGYEDEKGRHALATGHAQEKEQASYINKTSYIENCETSAVGRALGMCGFGIDTALCSAEELNSALAAQEAPKKPQGKALGLKCTECGNPIRDSQKKNGEVWPAYQIATYTAKRYGASLCCNCAMKKNRDEAGTGK